MTISRRWLLVVLLAALAGCARQPAPPAKAASRAVVEDFYGALLQRDWPHAYKVLHPESQKRCSLPQFAQLARNHVQNVGFVPDKFVVQSCEEEGNVAIAHVVFVNQHAAKKWRYKDATTLRQVAGDWRIVLPDGFGKRRG